MVESMAMKMEKPVAKQDVLMGSLIEFFSESDNLEKMLPIRDQTSEISLRVLDWFVTNYAKKNHVTYKLNDKDFDVYRDYKSQLKAFSKKSFDPFCRRERIDFYYGTGDDDYIETTVGQLNFFRWIISSEVLDYVKDNLDEIEDDMINSVSYKTKDTKKGKVTEAKIELKSRKKRQKLSVSASGTFVRDKAKITVTFD